MTLCIPSRKALLQLITLFASLTPVPFPTREITGRDLDLAAGKLRSGQGGPGSVFWEQRRGESERSGGEGRGGDPVIPTPGPVLGSRSKGPEPPPPSPVSLDLGSQTPGPASSRVPDPRGPPVPVTTPARFQGGASMSGSQCQLPAFTSPVSESFRLTVRAHINWQTYLTPISSSVALLAELVGLAKSGKDFPLKVDPIKSRSDTPKSFQGSLLEICQQAANSFLDIQSCMIKIQLNCNNMPDLLKKLGDGSCQDKCLSQRLKLSVELCKEATGGVEKVLSSLSEKLLQLLDGCSTSWSFSQIHHQEVQRILAQTRESIKVLEKDKATLEEDWSKVSLEREKIKGTLNEIKSKAFSETLCEEGLRELLDHFPQVLDLLGSVTNPAVLVSELGKGVKFILSEISALREKDSSSALCSFLADVEEKASQKIREAQSHLDQAGEKYKTQFQLAKKVSQEGARLSSNLSAQEREEREISSAVLLMANNLELLGGIRSNWSQVISFIHLLPKLLEDCQQMMERLGDGTGGDITLLPEFQDHVSQAVSIADLLRDMSKYFLKEYNKFLKDALSDLIDVLAKGDADYKLKVIRENCQKATENIQQSAQEDVEQFQQEVQKGSRALGKLAEHLSPRG
ncbi:uncharacterized protein [Narcine bancroftii]|uniref:uncharacterized protein n=1 Tax=Narcine bancroftii TaxID=1343680 RepID=UPI0038315D90